MTRWLWHSGTPRSKGRPRLVQGDRGGVWVYTPRGTRHEEDLIAGEWLSRYCQYGHITGDVALTVVAVGGQGDADNVAKLVCDALNGLNGAYLDDWQVKLLLVYRLPAGGGVPNGTLIGLRPLTKHWRRGVIAWLTRRLGTSGH